MIYTPQLEPPVLPRIYAWFSALIAEDTDLLDDLLAHGVPVDAPHPLRHSTALMEATRLGRIAMVHWLLERGATPAFLCGLPLGTPLHCALRLQHWAIAKMLADRIPSGAVIDAYGRTPLHLICMEPSDTDTQPVLLELAQMLIAKGCPLDALDHEGTTALHHCAINDHPELAELLLAAGSNPNALIPETRVSPLTIAALEKNLTLAALMLKFGADPYQKTRDGSSPATIHPGILRLNDQPPSAHQKLGKQLAERRRSHVN